MITEEKYKELRVSAKTNEEAFKRLWNIIEVLRRECPWDKVQTHESLIPCMLEEAYEAVDAINNKDISNLEEELGDVMLQVLTHSVIGEENREFSIVSIANRECEKMIRRHPHIFSEENAKTVDKVLEKWENVKREEKGITKQTKVLEDVPRALPALTRSCKLQKKAADVGFDWDDVSEAFRKIKEETDELLEVCSSGSAESITDELGDLLFSVVNVARFLRVDPEQALTRTSDKFVRRFYHIEETIISNGKSFDDVTLEEMDKLWNEAKMLEKLRKQENS